MNDSGTIAVVAHDAGGAEILASYASRENLRCRFALEGPAVKVFKRKFGDIETCSLEEAISESDWCLCGTSWQSDLEWDAIGLAKRKEKRVVSFLDHWVNYRERFSRKGIQRLPDEIWVGDPDAENLVRECFPGLPIVLVPNPHFLDIKQQVTALGIEKAKGEGKGKTVLFVSENISDHARLRHGNERYWGYTEFDAIEYLIRNLDTLGGPIERMVIRPHPSDPDGKYDFIVDANQGVIRLGGKETLLEEIAKADIITGCESMALVVGLLAGKRVISCIPEGGKPCRLPQKEIEHLGDFKGVR